METNHFTKLAISHWRQFKNVDIEFSESVTILTGRNGTGKTTILNMLAQHSSYSTSFVGSPLPPRDSFGRFTRYTSGYWDSTLDETSATADRVGSIEYSSGETSAILIPRDVAVNFSPELLPKVAVAVLHIPSHRRLPSYQAVETIPTKPITRETALKNYQKEFWSGITGSASRVAPLTRMKEALISMAAFGLGNARVRPNDDAEDIFADFERRLKAIIPANIGFQRLFVQIPDVVVETDSGRFLIDASSGGLMSLIDITWQLTLFTQKKTRFVAIIDEPENHLHPSMQREFLPALVGAFPEAQFIVATHSPFIVSSVRHAKVYAFDLDNPGTSDSAVAEDLTAASNAVVAIPIDLSDRTSASEILRQVLGVPITVPIWAERELDDVLQKFRGRQYTAEDIRELQADLAARGLQEFLPAAVAQATKK